MIFCEAHIVKQLVEINVVRVYLKPELSHYHF